jgi:hypothetical protein
MKKKDNMTPSKDHNATIDIEDTEMAEMSDREFI